MAKGKLGDHLVVVSPALSLAQHVALIDQLGQDPMSGTLGDANRRGDLAQADAGVAGYAHEDMGVIRQKVPGGSDHRSHEDRKPVLDKLRWMRGSEPLPGYDALSSEKVVTALKEADKSTIKEIRGYERKFGNRPDVLEEVVRALHLRQEIEPELAPPGTKAMRAKRE